MTAAQQRCLGLPDADATAACGAALARALDGVAGGTVWLSGELGAGKTTLTRGLLRALGIAGPIRSPTYTLLEPYERQPGAAPLRILHMDLYRLADPLELDNLGLDDYPPRECLWLVEWPERGGALLPQPDLLLRLVRAGNGRQLCWQIGRRDWEAPLRSALAAFGNTVVGA